MHTSTSSQSRRLALLHDQRNRWSAEHHRLLRQERQGYHVDPFAAGDAFTARLVLSWAIAVMEGRPADLTAPGSFTWLQHARNGTGDTHTTTTHDD